ncbi:MAG TPA: helix-turn-helix transcriptional regulator, partial [Pirellulales bacterium]|nr:helix-turn-helix transcriptional regulator [Pirellulales bacterium]
YGPGMPLEISSDSSNPMTKYYVTFVGRNAKRVLETAGFGPSGLRQVRSLHEVQDIFEMLQVNGLAHSHFSQQLCGSIVQTLAYKIAEQALPADARYSRALFSYLDVREAIDKHFLEMNTVEDVAAHCHKTPHYICTLFKRFDHVTPYQYLNRVRMQYAANLLSEPGVLVKQVARRLGFTDQFQFSRAFKRVFGVPPLEFQQQHAAK